jgi:hypothetical protein
MKPVDIAVIVTFHAEKLAAHQSLGSILRSCNHAESLGATTSLVLALDSVDPQTDRVVRTRAGLRPQDLLLDLAFKDVSLSRNCAVQESNSSFVAMLDGDDQVSTNWLAASLLRSSNAAAMSIVHPQVVVTFGAAAQYREQPDQSVKGVDEQGLLVTNYWNVCAFARREAFVTIPYVSTESDGMGFGFEDWHWNCETLAAGYTHLVAPGTVYFERRKDSGSLNHLHQKRGAVIRPSKLFRQSW